MSPGPSAFPTTNQAPYGPTLKAFVQSIGPTTNVVSVGGATGLGVADDTTAIHAARDNAGATGTLFFPPGTYKTSGLTANVVGQTWILAPGAVIQGTGVDHAITVSASGVTIQGPGKIDTGAASAFSGVFISAGLSDVDVLGVEVVNGTYGVRCKGGTGAVTTRLRVSGCTIHDTSSHGVFFNWETTDSEIASNQIYSTGGNGIWVGNSSFRCKINGNTITTSGRNGIEVFGGSTGATVVGNVLNGIATIGISLDTSDGSRVAFNRVENVTSSYGLECAASNKCVYEGNVVKSVGSLGMSISAASGTCDDNTIANNIFEACVTGGINAGGGANGAKRLRIIGNEIIDAGLAVPAIACATGIGCTDWLVANNTVRWTAAGTSSLPSCTGIQLGMPNTLAIGNLIVADAAITTAGGVGISLQSSALDCSAIGNLVLAGSKLNKGITLASACTGCTVTNNKTLNTLQDVINNSSASTTNYISGNVYTVAAGAGITMGGAVGVNKNTGSSIAVHTGSARFDGNVGFYGTTPITQPPAPTALPAAAPAGGTGTAAGGWDTAAHRDTAIAAINGLITTVGDIKAKLQALGLTL